MEILAFKHEGDATDLLLVLLQRIWHVQFLMHFLPLLMSLDWMDWNRTLAQNVRSSLMLCRRNLKIVTLFQFPWHERLRWREQKPTHSGTLWCWWYAHRTSQSSFTGDAWLFAGPADKDLHWRCGRLWPCETEGAARWQSCPLWLCFCGKWIDGIQGWSEDWRDIPCSAFGRGEIEEAHWVLRYFSDLDIPVKRGTFIEFRQGMLNLSPIGRNCSREERNEFEKFDLANGIRKTMVQKMKEEFADLNLTFQ